MFKKVSDPLTRAELAEIEAALGFVFPEDFIRHCLSYNGGIPEKPFFYSADTDVETEIQIFLPLKHPYGDIPIGTAEETYLFFKGKSPLMASYFPFANNYGGNLICINLENGGIYIVYMDLGGLTDQCFCRLADSFSDFAAGLSENSADD